MGQLPKGVVLLTAIESDRPALQVPLRRAVRRFGAAHLLYQTELLFASMFVPTKKPALGLTPLVATANRRVANALDMDGRSRVHLSRALDRFSLRRLDCTRPRGSALTHGIVVVKHVEMQKEARSWT